MFVSSPVRQLSQGLSGKSLQRSCCSINILHNRQPKPSHAAAAEEFLYRYHSVSLPFPRHVFLYRIVHICRCFSLHSISVTLSSCLTFSIFVHCPVDFPQRDETSRAAPGALNRPQRLTVRPGARLIHLNLTSRNEVGSLHCYTYALIKWLKKGHIVLFFLLFKRDRPPKIENVLCIILINYKNPC